MRERRNKRAKRIAIEKKLLAFSFLYLIFFAVNFSMVTFSKYSGIVSSEGISNIAKWEVAVDTNDNESSTLNVVAGNTPKSYILKINNSSYVKAKYSIVLSDVPNNIEVKLDNGSYTTPSNNIITFDNVGYINANANVRTITHTLTFNVPIDINIADENEINIDVIFEQVNPT